MNCEHTTITSPVPLIHHCDAVSTKAYYVLVTLYALDRWLDEMLPFLVQKEGKRL